MELALHGGGKVLMSAPQQKWHGDNPAVAQYARFAGQDMAAITDDAGAFQERWMLRPLQYRTGEAPAAPKT